MTAASELHKSDDDPAIAGVPSRRWDWIVAVRESELDSTARLVAFTLSFHMDADGSKAYPGPTLLSRESGLSLRSVKTKLGELERSGWLECVERGRSTLGGRLANRYRATVPTRAGDAPVQEVPRAGGSTTRAARSTTRAGDAPQTFSTPDDSTGRTRRTSTRSLAGAAGFGRNRAQAVIAGSMTESAFREELALTHHDADEQRVAIAAFAETMKSAPAQGVA